MLLVYVKLCNYLYIVCRASQEMEKVRKTTTAEVARLEAALKKSELKIHGLERSLEQKVHHNISMYKSFSRPSFHLLGNHYF